MTRRTTQVTALGGAALAWLLAVAPAAAQTFGPEAGASLTERDSLLHAVLRLPLAAALGAILAMRPRRAGTPPRKPAVVQTQVILAVIGALVMIVVGASLARAFGVVGIAGLIRYRAKVDDPKDASVMLAALGVGLAAGAGLFWLAPFATLFLLALLWLLESREPEPTIRFALTVKGKDVSRLRKRIETTLRRHHVEYSLRSRAADELVYAARVPLERGTDAVTSAIVHLGPPEGISLEWSEKKDKS
jgi:uncharacterized membrane protein YhiD involved in acid resistance